MLRFSLSSIMIAFAVFGITCTVLFVTPDPYFKLARIVTALLIGSVLAGLAVSGRALARSYAAGALPIGIYSVFFFQIEGNVFADSIKLSTSISVLLTAAGGCVAVFVSSLVAAPKACEKQDSPQARMEASIIAGLSMGLIAAGAIGMIDALLVVYFNTESLQSPPVRRY